MAQDAWADAEEKLQWLKENAPCAESPCAQAAWLGRLDLLQWLRRCDHAWDAETCFRAAQGGHLAVLQWVRSQTMPCPWNTWTCHWAAVGGHGNVLQWLRAQDPPCPWDENTCLYAAVYGRGNILQWLRAQTPPCPWDELAILNELAYCGPVDMVQWALEQGIPSQGIAWQQYLYDGYHPPACYQSWQWLQKHYNLAVPPRLQNWLATVDDATIGLPLCPDIKALLLRYC